MSMAFSDHGFVIPGVISTALCILAMLAIVILLQKRFDPKWTMIALGLLAMMVWLDAFNDLFVITGFYGAATITHAILSAPYHAANITMTC